jgi:hypothetical protein
VNHAAVPIYTHHYPDIFTKESISAVEDQNADAVYDLVDHVPSFWHDADPPVDNILTGYDVVFRSGDEPKHSPRADFLTGSVINSQRGYRALAQGRLSSQSMGNGARWHRDIRPTLRIFDSTFAATDVEALAGSMQRFDLQPDPMRNFEAVRRQTAAREQLALDLTLSGDIFSSQGFISPVLDDSIETMTESLSLNEEPSPVQFRFLQPIDKNAVEEPERKEGICPIGVRLLLKEWEVGSDPDLFTYKNPYRVAEDPSQSPRTHEPIHPLLAQTTSHPHRPPTVVASGSVLSGIPTFRRPIQHQSQPSPLPHYGSQPLTSAPLSAEESQELMMSTQVVAGPFGGRPPPVKKKPPKKRMGGF